MKNEKIPKILTNYMKDKRKPNEMAQARLGMNEIAHNWGKSTIRGVLSDTLMPLMSILLMIALSLLMIFKAHAQVSNASPGFGPVHRGTIYIGPNFPLGDFKDFTGTPATSRASGVNLAYGFAYDFGIGKRWGLGIDFNRQINTYQIPARFIQLPPPSSRYTTVVNQGKNWTTNTFGFGPWWMINFNPSGSSYLQVYSKVGVSQVKNPGASIVYSFNAATNNFFEMQAGTTGGLGVTTGLNIGIGLGKQFTLNINPQYVYSSAKVDYSYALVKDENSLFTQDAYDTAGNFFPIWALRDLKKFDATVSPSYFNLNVGLTYRFGKADGVHPWDGTYKRQPIRKPRKDKPGNGQLKSDPPKVYSITALDEEERKVNMESNDGFFIKANYEGNENEINKSKIAAISPSNHEKFKSSKVIKQFTWKVIGKAINKPNYVLEVTRLDKREAVRIIKTNKTRVAVSEIFMEESTEGQYTWKVTETNTGESSDPHLFDVHNCKYEWPIKEETIECLGMDKDGKIKYKICFVSSFNSEGGHPLNFNNSSSGMNLFDQSGASHSFQFTGTPSGLISQSASPGSVSYCIETSLPATATALNITLQGDQFSENSCTPRTSFGFDTLPSCICNDCSTMQLSIGSFNAEVNPLNPSIYNLTGNLNTGTTPIYGMEIQVVSYSYNSAPACTNGVTSIEESGMIISAGTQVNNSSNVEFVNETASGNGSGTNNNATKTIKYMSGSAMSGNIPLDLSIGLPATAAGLNPDCCPINYKVCLKIKVYYQDGSCRYCTFRKCFNFSNQ